MHTPLQVPDSYANKFSFIDDKDRQIYHAMVNYLEDVVGELVGTLKMKGMWENTHCLHQAVITETPSILGEEPTTIHLKAASFPTGKVVFV